MNALPLPLTAQNFGEWLAALGLLRVADSLAPGSTLHFDSTRRAILTTAASEESLMQQVIASADPERVGLQFFEEPDTQSRSSAVRIGDTHLVTTSRQLSQMTVATLKRNKPPEFHLIKKFADNKESKGGATLVFENLGGLVVPHYLGKAAGTYLAQKSPLRLWAGKVVLFDLLWNVSRFVAALPPALPLASACAATRTTPQRMRFDHHAEQVLEDGGWTLGDEGRPTRPVVEWLGLIALSFFPPEAGYTALLTAGGRLRAGLWREPLTSDAVLLALHFGSFTDSVHFAIASDGDFKKLRPAEAGRSLSDS